MEPYIIMNCHKTEFISKPSHINCGLAIELEISRTFSLLDTKYQTVKKVKQHGTSTWMDGCGCGTLQWCQN